MLRRNIMAKYVKKPVVIEAVTYEELIKMNMVNQ